jgi:hypothetical protein
MAKKTAPKKPAVDWDRLRQEWLGHLTDLVGQLEAWARELDWVTRRIDKRIDDAPKGPFTAPGLLLQKDFSRVMLEPINPPDPKSVPVADLYLMPAYDDLANLYFENGAWQVYYQAPESPRTTPAYKVRTKPLTKKLFREVIEEMSGHAAKVQ